MRARTRRTFLKGGLAALALGMVDGRVRGLAGTGRPQLTFGAGSPFLQVEPGSDTTVVGGLPFLEGYTGDAYTNDEIPFHHIVGVDAPEPEEDVDVAVVGGGIGGLSSAWLLRRYSPVVLEMRDRFGGSAQGEVWRGIPFSLGSAYFITPDDGSFLDRFYRGLKLQDVARRSFPPDPIELGGEIREDFWGGAGLPDAERQALARYREVVAYMADDGYPEIPLPEDPESVRWVVELDRKNFREDLEARMGTPLTPLLAAAVQAYFYSSFGAGIDEVSAAGGWNFVAAEEYGRWVLPGGNAYLAWAMWDRLHRRDPSRLRPSSRVVDVRLDGDGVRVTWFDRAEDRLRALRARHVVLGGSKHVAKHILPDLERLDPEKHQAMLEINTAAYLVANVLVDGPVHPDLYDVFLVGDRDFPMDHGTLSLERPVIDVLRGDYASLHGEAAVLTLYWPLAYPAGRAALIAPEAWSAFVEGVVPQMRRILELMGVKRSAVRQVRITRWGHALPVAAPGFIADGAADRVRRPLGERIHFVNQDNWVLPAVENTVLDAETTARVIRAHLG